MAIGATLLIERLGGRAGGLIGTLPTTIVPASLGIHDQAADEAAFVAALCMTPAGMLLNALFLWMWRALPPRLPPMALPRRLGLMVALSLGAWSLGAAALTFGAARALARGVPPQALGLAALLLMVALGLGATWRPRQAPKGRRDVGARTLLARGLLAAAAIAAGVAASGLGSPLVAGMASVFPAIFLTTMVSLWLTQGEAVPMGAVGPMMLGSSSVAAYALLATLALPALGPLPGALAAWGVAAVGVTWPAWWWLGRSTRPARASS